MVAKVRMAPWGTMARAGNGPGGLRGITMTKIIKNLWNDDSGASAAEYALILAIVGTGIAAAAFVLGSAISNEMNSAANCITRTPSATAC